MMAVNVCAAEAAAATRISCVSAVCAAVHSSYCIHRHVHQQVMTARSDARASRVRETLAAAAHAASKASMTPAACYGQGQEEEDCWAMHGMPARHARRIANVASEPTVAPTDTVPCTFTALSTPPAQTGRWYLDSGVSDCRCREHRLVDFVQPCAQPHVAFGHGNRAPILGSGIVTSASRLQRVDSLIDSTRWRTSASSRALHQRGRRLSSLRPAWASASQLHSPSFDTASRSSQQPTWTRLATSTACGLLLEQRLALQPPSPLLRTSPSSRAGSASRHGGDR
jgi:hypothetical protein